MSTESVATRHVANDTICIGIMHVLELTYDHDALSSQSIHSNFLQKLNN